MTTLEELIAEMRVAADATADYGMRGMRGKAYIDSWADRLEALTAQPALSVELPELPEPAWETWQSYTADQMRAYGQACRLASAPVESAGAVACVTISHFGEVPQMENRDFDYYGNLPPGTYSLYTHPAPAGSDVTEAYKAVALMTGMDAYGPRLEWRSHWADHNGKTLYVKAANAARGEKGL